MEDEIKTRICFSQEGEDVLLERVIHDIHFKGSFVDIGAHHPIKLSNTYKFYCAGWRGINIEATPGSIDVFNKIRPLDINIEVPVSDKEEELTFYTFNHPELNTFSKSHAEHWANQENVVITGRLNLKTSTISSILEKHYKKGKVFDLLTIDVEGLDLSIIKTIDFQKYLFNFIVIEDESDISNISNSEIAKFLNSKGYKLLSKLFLSSIYYFDYSSTEGKLFLKNLDLTVNPETLTKSRWVSRFIDSLYEINDLVLVDQAYILADQGEWGVGRRISYRRCIPFMEHDGQYWGPPSDDASAIEEIEKQRVSGVNFIFFAWPAFWLLEYYHEMDRYLKLNYKCVIDNERLKGFSLQQK